MLYEAAALASTKAAGDGFPRRTGRASRSLAASQQDDRWRAFLVRGDPGICLCLSSGQEMR